MAGSRIRNTVIPIFNYNIKALVLDFKDGLVMIIGNLFLKDPCNKCLVRPCCTEQCEHKIHVINMMLPYKSLLESKIMAGWTLFTLIISTLAFISVIFETFIL